MLDYLTLKMIWWLFVTLLVLGFMILGGRDLGVAALLPWVAKTDEERRLLLNSIGPTWEGNQVWFMTAGGALFAAWPLVYAVAFSGLYEALLLVLLALILRPPGIDYRGKLPHLAWRLTWDWALFFSGVVPSLLIGVALGNVFLGLPFHLDDDLRSVYTGSFIRLLHPAALLMGVVSLSLCTLQGALFLNTKISLVTIRQRAQQWVKVSGVLALVGFLVLGGWLFILPGYEIQAIGALGSALIPSQKTVLVVKGAWLMRALGNQAIWVTVTTVILGVLGALWCCGRRPRTAFALHSAAIVGVVGTAALTLYPFILPSSSQPDHSLTIWDATSSHKSLTLMFWVVIVFLPIVLGYTFFVYHKMRGLLMGADLNKPEAY